MRLFDALLSALLGPAVDFHVEPGPDGFPHIVLGAGPHAGSRAILETDCLVLVDGDSEAAEEAFAPLIPLGVHLCKLQRFLTHFPAELKSDDPERYTTVDLAPPHEHPLWSAEGLHALVRMTAYVRDADPRGEVSSVEGERLVVPSAALDREDWDAQLADLDARLAAATVEAQDLDAACLNADWSPAPPSVSDLDPAWQIWSARLDLAGARDRVERALARTAAVAPAVHTRYTRMYALPFPPWLDHLAALLEALGELPFDPDPLYYEATPGWQRGNAWLDQALGMRAAGLLDWYVPGNLERATVEAAQMYDAVPPGGEGPLDPRLDMRYRADAPQLVTFLGGDSDGLHWGLWYDSPAYAPVIAHNYARDSAETWIDGDALIPWLSATLLEKQRQAADELDLNIDNDELRPYALGGLRALRVVELHLAALAELAPATPDAPAPCPWPRTERHPVGSPRLALRPGSGDVPPHVPDFGPYSDDANPPTETRRAWIDAARRELADGSSGYALALGLYLHWLDSDDLRAEAGQLLLDAYTTAGYQPFADILRVHLLHRDLSSVGVFVR